MKAISKVLGGFASKKDRKLPPINDTIASSLCQVISFLDSYHYDEEGLYRVPGDAEETEEVYLSIINGSVTSKLLQECSEPHCIASAIKRVLSCHEPLISYRYYDAFVAPDANYSELLEKLPPNSRRVLDIILSHINHVVASPRSRMTYSNIAICFGMQLLRPLSADNTSADTDLPSATAELKTREKALLSLFSSSKNKSTLEHKVDAMINEKCTATVQQRSVKITAPHSDPMNEAMREQIKNKLHIIGNVLHVAAKDDRTLVAMYETRAAAEKCVDELQLPPRYKIKLLDPTPVSPPDSSSAEVVAIVEEEVSTEVDEPQVDSPSEQHDDVVDSLNDISTIKHKTIDSDVVYLNDFSSVSEAVNDDLSIEDVSATPSPVPISESPTPQPEEKTEEPVTQTASATPGPKIVVRKNTARVIRVGGDATPVATAQSSAESAADSHHVDEPATSIEVDRNNVSSSLDISSTANPLDKSHADQPTETLSEHVDSINLSNVQSTSSVQDVAARLFNALDSSGSGVLDPQTLIRAFSRNRKFFEWLDLNSENAASLVDTLQSLRHEISLDDFIGHIISAQQVMDREDVDAEESPAIEQNVEEDSLEDVVQPSSPTIVRTATAKPPLPEGKALPADPVERLSALLLRNRRISTDKPSRSAPPPHITSIKHPLRVAQRERYVNAVNIITPHPQTNKDEVAHLQQEMLEMRRDYEQILQSKASELLLHEQSEASYLAELTSARRRITELESALMIEKDVVRRIKIESCNKDAELKSLQSVRGQTEDYAATIKEAAEREALSTVMAQQRLISLLESERDAALGTATALKREMESLSAAHKEAVSEALAWKEKYMNLQQLLPRNDENNAPPQVPESERMKDRSTDAESLVSITQEAVNKYLSHASKQQHKAINAYIDPPLHVPPPSFIESPIRVHNPSTSVTPTRKTEETTPVTSPLIVSHVAGGETISREEDNGTAEDSAESFIHQQRNRFQQALEAQTILSDKLLRNLASARKDLATTSANTSSDFSSAALVSRPQTNLTASIASRRREYVPRSEKFSEWYFNS